MQKLLFINYKYYYYVIINYYYYLSNYLVNVVHCMCLGCIRFDLIHNAFKIEMEMNIAVEIPILSF